MFHDRKFHKSKLIAQGMSSVFELLFMESWDQVKLSGAYHLPLLARALIAIRRDRWLVS